MAENDIYNSERKYERFKKNIDKFILKPERRNGIYKGKYYCKNKDNIKYFKKLFSHFEAQDLSYIRRIRVLQNFKIICYSTKKDLSECNRKNINNIAAFMHSVYMSPKSKSDFIKDIKYLWKLLFPEKDGKGRADETIVPYVVKHLKEKTSLF